MMNGAHFVQAWREDEVTHPALTPILQENIDEIISAHAGGVYSSK